MEKEKLKMEFYSKLKNLSDCLEEVKMDKGERILIEKLFEDFSRIVSELFSHEKTTQ